MEVAAVAAAAGTGAPGGGDAGMDSRLDQETAQWLRWDKVRGPSGPGAPGGGAGSPLLWRVEVLLLLPAGPSGSCPKVKGRPPGLVGVAGLWPIRSWPGKVVPEPNLPSGEPGASRAPGASSDRVPATLPEGSPSAVGGASPSDPDLFPLFLRLLGTWQSGIPGRLVANIGAFRWACLASGFFPRSLTLLGRRWGAPGHSTLAFHSLRCWRRDPAPDTIPSLLSNLGVSLPICSVSCTCLHSWKFPLALFC